eukprot:TRINITY_DN198_c0_g1_i1.p1 TRINITY_DN198_c0_g1~~TRINITY_DN198_c0_g1_i1.p1  ORF type:complete len:725 (-),score=106.67 TRINITY_DN198_c0_g1_i1:3379-5553(-)
MSTAQDFRNLVGGDSAAPESSSYHNRTDSDLTDDILKSRSSGFDYSFRSNDDGIMPSMNLDLSSTFPAQTMAASDLTGSNEDRSGDEGIERTLASSKSIMKSARKHYRDHSYTRRSFDATFRQFEGRYKTHAFFSPQHGVIRSEVVQYEELNGAQEKKSFLKLSKKKLEKVGSAQMILHGSCLYFFRQDRGTVVVGEEQESVRAVFLLDHCDYQIVPTEESTEAALDILPGGQQRLRIYLGSEDNRQQWLNALKESSPYHSAELITEARQDINQLQNELDDTRAELDATKCQCRFLKEAQEALQKEFEAEKEDYEEQIQMLQDEQRVHRQMKNTQQGEFNATVQERDEMEEQLQQLLEQRDQMREERVALRRHCQKMDTEMREVRQKGKEKDREFKSLNKQIAKQVDIIDKLKKAAENYKAQAKEMPEWRQRAKELENINIEMKEDLGAMEEDLGAMEEELEACHQEKLGLQDAVKQMENKIQLLLDERQDRDMHLRDLAEEVERLSGSKPPSNQTSSVNNSNSTTREHQNRRRSDSFLDIGDNVDFHVPSGQPEIQEDKQAMQRKLELAQEKMRQMQTQLNVKQKEINMFEHRSAAFDMYMETVGSKNTALESEVKRLQLKLEEAKRVAGSGNNLYKNAPMDVEMVKDPAFHLEFVLQHASELAIENEKLRTYVTQQRGGLSLNPHIFDQPPTPTFNINSGKTRKGGPRVHNKVQSMTALDMI